MEEQNRPFDQGPYLSAALLCEKVLEERDGIKSAIRIVDRVVRSAVGPMPPRQMEPFEYDLTLLVKFKSGRARGSQTLEIKIMKPSGEWWGPVLTNSLLFEGEDDRGVDLMANIRFRFEQTGVYWVYVFLENQFVTKLPLRVVYVPQVTPTRAS